MVEFVRDVIIAVAVHPGADAEPKRQGSALGTAVAAGVTQEVVAPTAQLQSAVASK